MKTFVYCAVVLSCLVVSSCSKKSEDQNRNHPLQSVLNQKMVVDTTILLRQGSSFEFGHRFYSSRKGLITQLGCYMPYKGSIRVTLWDVDKKEHIIYTEIASDSAGFKFADITPVLIEPNKRYVVSLNTFSSGTYRNYYVARKGTSQTTIYPFTSGDITFEALQSLVTSTPRYPTETDARSQAFVGGFSDFTFVPQ